MLGRPAGTARGLVVLLHGGFWSDAYGLDLMEPLARDLRQRGYATWNVEFRRIGSGGGFPNTFTDVAVAIDRIPGLGLGEHVPVAVVGHSAGGQLAAWAASRNDRTPGGPPRVTAAATITLSGVLCLASADREGVGGGSAGALMAEHFTGKPSAYDLADPVRLTPSHGRLTAIHAVDDQIVPVSQSEDYVTADVAAGAAAELLLVPGDHFALIDPGSTGWHRCVDRIAGVAGSGGPTRPLGSPT